MPRPDRSVSSTPSSLESEEIALETDGCVTKSFAAAAETEPSRATARKHASWLSVRAIGAVLYARRFP
jgi:hypothetical protein